MVQMANAQVDRRLQQQQQRSGTQKETKKLTWEEQLDIIMPPMIQELHLDGLQAAAIRNLLLDQFRQSNILTKEDDFDQQRKREESIKMMENTDGEIKKLLSPEQIELYDNYKKDVRSGKFRSKKRH